MSGFFVSKRLNPIFSSQLCAMTLRSFFAVIFVGLTSCTQKIVNDSSKQDQRNSVITHAEHLQIFDEDSIVRIHIIRGEGHSHVKLLLANRKPSVIPEGYSFIQTPIDRIAALSSTQIGMLEKIGSLSTICAVSNKKYIYSSKLIQKINSGSVRSLGDEGTIPAESIIQSGSKYVIFSDFGQDFPHAKQLAAMGILCIPNPDWQETHPLGKAEWMKFFGYLTGKKEKANAIFNETVKAYTDLVNKTKGLTNKPLITSGNMIGDIWYAPAGNSYNARLIEHAGANYIYKKSAGTGSIERSAEQVIQDNQKTEFWINPGFATKKQILLNFPKLKHLSFIDGINIYCYSKQMNRFWELGAAEPHHILEDLIRIVHPELLPTGKMYFYTVVN
jgi:iron complex transport system substrate-binding protein